MIFGLGLGLGGCGGPQFASVGSVTASAPISIERIELSWSNVYLLRAGDALALVDSGSPVDRDALAAACAARAIDVKQLRVAVITHAHGDHAGLARWLQTQGVPIVLGAADVRVAAAGHNDPLPATGLIAGWLAPLFMFSYEPFVPDVVVDHEIDLGAYGFPDAHVVPAPGHTAGSIAVVVGDAAFAGDMFKGGHLAKIGVHVPSEHFYQADPAADHRAVAALLARGVARFYIGHGGPVDADAVRAWLVDADEPTAPRLATIEVAANGELPQDGGGYGLAGLVRARFGFGGHVAYFGGFDVRAGELDGAHLAVDAHVVGIALQSTGGMLALTAGVGFGGERGIGATHLPVELSGEVPVGPVRVLVRESLAWRLGGARYAGNAWLADEATLLVGIRLGGEHAWGKVFAGEGPYLALTYRNLGGAELSGIAFGFDLSAADWR